MTPEWWQDLDGLEGVVLAIGAVISAAGAILAARWSYLSRNHAKCAEDQVTNDHSSNLREDVDKIGAAVGDLSRQIHDVSLSVARIEDIASATRSQGHQIGEITGHIRDLRGDLRDAVQRHEDDIKRLDSPASPQP